MTPIQQVRLAQVIQSIYCSAPVPDGWTLLDRVFVPEDASPLALLLRDVFSGKVALAVRGSETGFDWVSDFRFAFRTSPFGTGRTEEGFTTVFSQAKAESGNPLPPVDWLGGHSLGGPVATYLGCALAPAEAGADLLLIATPEPGDGDFAAWAATKFANVHRWENPHDVVPDAPGRFLGYRDLPGPATVIDMEPFGVSPWDAGGNHHLPNYIAAFMRQNPP